MGGNCAFSRPNNGTVLLKLSLHGLSRLQRHESWFTGNGDIEDGVVGVALLSKDEASFSPADAVADLFGVDAFTGDVDAGDLDELFLVLFMLVWSDCQTRYQGDGS